MKHRSKTLWLFLFPLYSSIYSQTSEINYRRCITCENGDQSNQTYQYGADASYMDYINIIANDYGPRRTSAITTYN